MTSNGSAREALAEGETTALSGLARLTTSAFQGTDLTPLAMRLIARASADPSDANALMDLSTVLLLQGIDDVGLATQAHALQVCRHYRLPAAKVPSLRLLAFMAPGGLMTNAPLPFLLDGSDVALEMLYLEPGEPIPEFPPHDVAYVAISESSATRPLLHALDAALAARGVPVLNRPSLIAATARDEAFLRLAGLDTVRIPASAQVRRADLARVAAGEIPIGARVPDCEFPVIVRPVDSHAGHDLARLEHARDLRAYLETTAGDGFFVSSFVDYRDADGLYRKYRVATIDGEPFAVHLGVSSHWMIHYLNAGMTESAAKRAEEERFMRDFDADFGRRHGDALREIARRFGLDYLVIDCAQTPDGRLLVFEVDPGAVVHAMDSDAMFPYKRPAMRRVFDAFRSTLERARRAP